MNGTSPAAQVAAVAHALRALPIEGLDDADRIDAIRQLEELRGAVAAAQARLTAAFVASQRAEQARAGVAADRIGRGVTAQVALARRISPYAANRYAGWATILTTELPRTFAQLAAGRTSEWRATLVARETAWLSRQHREQVDAELAPRLAGLGDRRTECEVRAAAYRLDPHGYVDRLRQAEADRHVSLRPAPDMMTRLSAVLPLTQGVAVRAALAQAAGMARAAGDPRTLQQVMADTLVERCTGQASADAVAVEVQLVVPAAALVNAKDDPDRDAPAHLQDYGPVPAEVVRSLLRERPASAATWLRRLFAGPTGELVAMESHRRTFTAAQRRFVTARDQYCRTPWCEALIRHVDHVHPHKLGGRTSLANADGLCEACNYAKQAPGWSAHTEGDGLSPDIVTRTPTGHRYRSRAPVLFRPARPITVDRLTHRAA